MANYYIYCYTNLVNGKKYIGQSKDLSRRCHPANYRGCTKFYNAIQKYGWENFSQIILEEGLTLEEANQKEKHYIELYNTVVDGYNLKSGGLNCEYSKQSRDKMSQSCKTKQKIRYIETNEEFESAKQIEKEKGYANANIIAACRGRLATAYGYHWEYINNPIFPSFKKDKRKKSVECIETGEIYSSAAEAARSKMIDRSNISACCAGKIKTAGGYHWRFAKN